MTNFRAGQRIAGQYHGEKFAGTLLLVEADCSGWHAGMFRFYVKLDAPITVFGCVNDTICISSDGAGQADADRNIPTMFSAERL